MTNRYGRYTAWRDSQAKTMSGNQNIRYAEAVQQYLPSVKDAFPWPGKYHTLASNI